MRVLRQGLTSGLCGLVGIWAAVGCGDAEVATPPNGFNDGGSSGAGNSGGTLNGGTGGLIDTDGGGAGGTAGDSGVDPCVGVDCGADQHCEADGDMSNCVANTCEELMCSGNTVCIETTDGAHCEEKCTDRSNSKSTPDKTATSDSGKRAPAKPMMTLTKPLSS